MFLTLTSDLRPQAESEKEYSRHTRARDHTCDLFGCWLVCHVNAEHYIELETRTEGTISHCVLAGAVWELYLTTVLVSQYFEFFDPLQHTRDQVEQFKSSELVQVDCININISITCNTRSFAQLGTP